jgi:hypothetical protein
MALNWLDCFSRGPAWMAELQGQAGFEVLPVAAHHFGLLQERMPFFAVHSQRKGLI